MWNEMTRRAVQIAVQRALNCAGVQEVCRSRSGRLARFEAGNRATGVQVCKQTAPLIGGGGVCIVDGLDTLGTRS